MTYLRNEVIFNFISMKFIGAFNNKKTLNRIAFFFLLKNVKDVSEKAVTVGISNRIFGWGGLRKIVMRQ